MGDSPGVPPKNGKTAKVLTTPLPTVPSSAILMYLSSKYQVADHWYPADLQARARVHEYLGWHADNVRGIFGVPLWTKVCRVLWGGIGPGKSQGYIRSTSAARSGVGATHWDPDPRGESGTEPKEYVRVSAASGGKVLWEWDLPCWPSGDAG